MPYSELMVAPMRQDLVRLGFKEMKAREYFAGYPHSSPAVALLKDGDLVFMMERHQIEGQSPQEIAEALKLAFDEHCG